MKNDHKKWLRDAVSGFAGYSISHHGIGTPLIDAALFAAEHIERIERERDGARTILAHTDIGSLPNDWTLTQVAEARIDDLMKLRDQVRDTCARAEKAEAENERLRPNAERYEWLRKQPVSTDFGRSFRANESLDESIDAARKP